VSYGQGKKENFKGNSIDNSRTSKTEDYLGEVTNRGKENVIAGNAVRKGSGPEKGRDRKGTRGT